jgi:hypothetical protein
MRVVASINHIITFHLIRSSHQATTLTVILERNENFFHGFTPARMAAGKFEVNQKGFPATASSFKIRE